ncbi:MAG: hypothetical protein ABI333_14135 [bacterium]
MMNRSDVLLLFGILLLGGAVGCARDSAAGECQHNNDCAQGYHCDQGTCVSDAPGPDATTADAQTADGEVSCAAEELPFSDAEETVVIPDHARYMHVKLWGAGGNDESQCPWTDNGAGLDGGQGGFTEAIFEIHAGTALAPGTELVVIVGAAGLAGASSSRFGFGVRGGGGLTGVFFGPAPIEAGDAVQALAVAGGGGSAGAPNCHPGGPGNHPDAGGRADMQGGEGADSDHIIGGGGGFEGGPGGDLNLAATGGAGFVDETLALDHRLHSAVSGDNPVPGSTDEDYLAQGGTAGRSEQPGLAIIRFTCAL